MANNTTGNPGSGGDAFTMLELQPFTAYPTDGKAGIVCLYVSQNAAVKPTPVSLANPVPVSLQAPVSLAGLPLPVTDSGPSWTTARGVAGVPVSSADLTAAAAITDAPTAGQKLVLDDLLFSANVDTRITLTEETSGTILGYVRCPSKGTVQVTLRGKLKLATADKKIRAQADVAGAVEVLALYHSEP